MNYFLWFLLFLSVPIIVHLFNFRRAKKLLFTNVRFIQKVSTETRSKTRLKHLLILSTRILSFLFLILAFVLSLVQLSSDELINTDSMGLFYLDNSYSSIGDSVDDEITFLEELILSKGANAGVLLTNDFSSFSNIERSKTEIIDRLNQLSTSYIGRSISEILDRSGNQKKNYLISDFQASTFEELTSIKQDTTRDYYLVFKENSKLNNVFVDSIWIERDLENYSNLLLNCQINRTNDFNEGSIIVKLISESGDQISSVVKDVSTALEISFSLPQDYSGSLYKVQMSGDEIEFDNEFYINLGKNISPSVLVLSASNNKYLNAIFGNDELFELSISGGDIDYELLNEANLVVVNDFFQLPDGLVSQYLNQTSFIIIPADSIDMDSYQSETGFLLRRGTEAGLQEIEMAKGTALLRGIYKKTDETISLPNANAQLELANPHERILSLRNGETFLAKSIATKLYFFTSPLLDEYTNFHNHSSFLPIMYRIADESVDVDPKLFVYPNDFLEISGMSPDVPPKIIGKEVEIVPEFSLRNNDGLVKMPNNLAPGFYHLVQGNDTLKSIGLNLPKSESLFEGPTYAELKDFFEGSSHVQVVSISDENSTRLLTSHESDGLWKYALILALIFITVETAFHRYLK